MTDEQKWEIAFNFAVVVPAIIRGLPGAIEAGQKMWDALKGGVTAEEWASSTAEREAVLASIIAKTKPAE